MVASLGTHGRIFGEPDQHKLRQNRDRDLVLDLRILMLGLGRLDRGERYQRHSCGIAEKHHDLHADVLRGLGYALGSQHDGGCGYRRGGDQRRVWIGERHERIVCTFDQPLLNRHVVDAGRFGPVDMELRRF